jgi:hypothetical protein
MSDLPCDTRAKKRGTQIEEVESQLVVIGHVDGDNRLDGVTSAHTDNAAESEDK